MTASLLDDAIQKKKCLTGLYEGHARHFAPHALGASDDGTLHVFVFQYGGESSTRLPPGGEWRCFRVGSLSELRLNEDRWRSRSNYSLKRQHCLARIDIAVPTSS